MASLKMVIPKDKPYRAYIPTELVEDGFSGQVEIFTSNFAAVIIKPSANDSEAIKGVSLVLQDLGLKAGKIIRITVNNPAE